MEDSEQLETVKARGLEREDSPRLDVRARLEGSALRGGLGCIGEGGRGPTRVLYRLDGGSAPYGSSKISVEAGFYIMVVAGDTEEGASAP